MGRDRPGWQWKRLPVGRLLGAEQIGASLYELAPGQKTFPYHWQVLEEEWLIVIRGEPTLRDPSGERKLAPGRLRRLQARARKGRTSSATTPTSRCGILMLSAESKAEIAFYPDSGKVGIYGPDMRKLLDENAELDYFDGEE